MSIKKKSLSACVLSAATAGFTNPSGGGGGKNASFSPTSPSCVSSDVLGEVLCSSGDKIVNGNKVYVIEEE